MNARERFQRTMRYQPVDRLPVILLEPFKGYGVEQSLRLAGGISKQTLIDGPDAIDRELERLLPIIAEGGFIPAPDDSIPPEVPFATFRHYLEAVRAIRW